MLYVIPIKVIDVQNYNTLDKDKFSSLYKFMLQLFWYEGDCIIIASVENIKSLPMIPIIWH